MEIIRGMYGLPQAIIPENKLLAQRFRNHGYYHYRQITGLWRNECIPISLTLLVDDFVIGYVGHEHANNLMSALNMYY